jgi:deoxyribodipyrimidine photolyase-related protein
MKTVWILGDQLHEEHPALAQADRRHDWVLFVESRRHSTQVNHHQLKLVLIFSAMRHRAKALRKDGWQVDYIELTGDFTEGLKTHIETHAPDSILMQEPSQYAFRQAIPKLARKLGVTIDVLPTNQFLVPEAEFSAWADGHPHLLMEHHYRRVRKKLKLLIEPNGEPTGGAWNFDIKNRQTHASFRRSHLSAPRAPHIPPDAITKGVIALVKEEFADHPGDAGRFWLPVTRQDSLKWLHDFIEHRLEHFGPWEDMMDAEAPVLFHSVLTPMPNIGLLTPRECVDAAIEAYRQGHVPLASTEGFVRQIIGWREFINGVYWHRMPGYEDLNALEAHRPLPDWIYTGETEMNCLHHVIRQVVKMGYNHHIQRLMVLGNFFLLGGFSPSAVLRWYLEMYVDAHDWVMAANVIGMVLHADGGYMATKPYAAGAGYINKMSNYCQGCRYDPKQRTGPDACPFNYLYWNFYAAHQERFAQNRRIGMAIKTWHDKTSTERNDILRQADSFLSSL